MTRTRNDTVFVRFISREADFAFIKNYDELAPDIIARSNLDPRDPSTIDLRLDGKRCTFESKVAFLDALRAWLQTRHNSGDRTHDGLSALAEQAFIEMARIEYLQPMEDQKCSK